MLRLLANTNVLAEKLDLTLDSDPIQITNIYFKPDAEFSTDNTGIDAVVTVTMNGENHTKHDITDALNIVVQGVADDPTKVANPKTDDDPTNDNDPYYRDKGIWR